jgi:hypothetical protein
MWDDINGERKKVAWYVFPHNQVAFHLRPCPPPLLCFSIVPVFPPW